MAIILETVPSTNTYVKENFFSLADGTCVAALEQTAGRGRLGRKWMANRGESIALSAAFRRVQAGFHAGAIVGVAALDVLRTLAPEADFFFKWPNDIYVKNAKIAGILSEGIIRDGQLAGVVCGIGINLNQSCETLALTGVPACSIFSLTGMEKDVEKVIFLLEKSINECYIRYNRNPKDVLSRWRSENRLAGRKLQFIPPDGNAFEGVFVEIDENGAMSVQTADGLRTFDCGDVKICTDTL